nr:hypothetical protein [Myxococcota bacterium]
MELIEGFAWAVPRALAGAASACRFEQGDVLYRDPGAYEAWSGASPASKFALQVLDPPKTARALSAESEGNRFEANWSSAVELELTDCKSGETRRCRTTQGRLFSCLWRGDPDQLDPEGAEPEPPLPQRELHRRLAEAQPGFQAAFRALEGNGLQGGFGLYLSALDDSSEASRAKARAVDAALRADFDAVGLVLSPHESGLPGAAQLHPALRVQGLAMVAPEPGAVEKRLRDLLYG